MKKIELLAPAGDLNCLKAAIEAGADAVYFGLSSFNARVRANNFKVDDLAEVIDYSHTRDVKSYLTLNTLVNNSELGLALEILNKAYEFGIDGVIVQDLGLAALIKSNFQDLPMHGSTQMTIYDLNGVIALEKLGFKRVVLAREMSWQKAIAIAKSTNMEIEVFVHGALCVSYSGQCLMSSYIGGRSGNRGECAQPCRLEYDILLGNKPILKDTGNKHIFSMKDLSTIGQIGKIVSSPVRSMKIEGRMKGPEYVFSVVQSYRNVLENIYNKDSQDLPLVDYQEYMAKVFNRGGFTKGFLLNEAKENVVYPPKPNNCGVPIGKTYQNIADRDEIEIILDSNLAMGDVLEGFCDKDKEYRSFKITKIVKDRRKVGLAYKGETVTVNSKFKFNEATKLFKVYDQNLMKKISINIKNDTKKIDLYGEFTLKNNEYPNLKIYFGTTIIEEKGLVKPEKAINRAIDREKIYNQLTKTKSTTFNFAEMKISIDTGLSLQISEINDLRRRALAKVKDLMILGTRRQKVNNLDKLIITKDYTHGSSREMTSENLPKNKKVSIQFLNWQVPYNLAEIQTDRYYMPMEYFLNNSPEDIYQALNSFKQRNIETFIALPTITKDKYWEVFQANITKYLADKLLDGVLISNMGQMSKVNAAYYQANFTLNIFNDTSVQEMKKLGFNGVTYSTELNAEQIKDINQDGIESEIVVYGRLPIMYSEYCLKKNQKIACHVKDIKVTDKMGYEFPIICDKLNCISTVLNSKILYLKNDFDIIRKANVERIRLLITDETPNQVNILVNEHKNLLEKSFSAIGNNNIYNNTKGHYLRGV